MAPRKDRPKKRLAVSIEADMHDWLTARVGPGRPFGSYTHAVETAIQKLMAAQK